MGSGRRWSDFRLYEVNFFFYFELKKKKKNIYGKITSIAISETKKKFLGTISPEISIIVSTKANLWEQGGIVGIAGYTIWIPDYADFNGQKMKILRFFDTWWNMAKSGPICQKSWRTATKIPSVIVSKSWWGPFAIKTRM